MLFLDDNLGRYGKHLYVGTALVLMSLVIAAQKDDVIRLQPCSDSLITHEVDSLKNFYTKNGFALLREATIAMQSQFELPVIVPLNEGNWYQFIFIGDNTSQLYEVRMYDWDEKMVVYQKKQWGDVDGNIISYSYIPKFSEYHMMKPVQVNKHKKNLCGCVMLFVKKGPR
jgi:hypothetical protein